MDEHPRPRALSLAGETVDFVGVDYMVTLRFSNNASTAFEAAFTVREPGGPSFEVIPDGDKASLVPFLDPGLDHRLGVQTQGYRLSLI
jgi:hypothetical protein